MQVRFLPGAPMPRLCFIAQCVGQHQHRNRPHGEGSDAKWTLHQGGGLHFCGEHLALFQAHDGTQERRESMRCNYGAPLFSASQSVIADKGWTRREVSTSGGWRG
ncbi:MAG: hypothetical protein C4K60_05505 [Ideonella sp. MAG2]|nr:MAG: hypothetical protein C4K60_05505 [Ideonella sp. MAG2]